MLVTYNLFIHATTYTVGPGQTYAHIIDIPVLDNLQPGDSIKVYYQPDHYFEKFRLYGVGTSNNPIVLIGIPDNNGNKPVLDGKNAISNSTSYANEDRQVIKIGEYGSLIADYVIIEGFEIRNANANYQFIDDTGTPTDYQDNACAFRPESCKHTIVRNCMLDSCGNSFQGGNAVLDNTVTHDNPTEILVEYCSLFDNGNPADPSSDQEHQLYSFGGVGSVLTLQYNRLGNVMDAGAQIKTRSETNIIRYNWVDGGDNDMLQLIEDMRNGVQHNYVYGNVFIKSTGNSNNRLILVGWDSSPQPNGDSTYFYNNTVISKDPGGDRFFRTIDTTVHIFADNNIFYAVNSTYLLFNDGPDTTIRGKNNWISSFATGINSAAVTNSILSVDPGFVDFVNSDLHLTATSECRDVVMGFVPPAGFPLSEEYVMDLQSQPRPSDGKLDLGAFEYDGLTSVNNIAKSINDILLYPNPSDGQLNLYLKTEKLSNTASIIIMDVSGKELIREIKPLNIERMLSIDAEILTPGIYFIKVITDKNTEVVKFTKQ